MRREIDRLQTLGGPVMDSTRGHSLRPRLFFAGGDALPALAVLALPFGPLPIPGLGAGIYASQIIIIALMFQTILTRRGREMLPGPVLVASVALLAVPALLANNLNSSILAYFNFAVGTLGGVIIGMYWREAPPKRLNLVDCALFAVPCIAAIQLAINASANAGSFSIDREYSDVGWGSSNYVAGIISISCVAALARLLETKAPKWAYVPLICAATCSLITLSRGGIICLSAGLIVLLWRKPRRPGAPPFARALAIGIIPLGLAGVSWVWATREIVNNRVNLNVDLRLALYKLSWNAFIDHPIAGTGWTGLRETSLALTGEQQSFAHNALLSFLQIGGLAAMPFIFLAVRAFLRAFRHGGLLAAAIASVLAFSLTDPLLEGTIGSAITWMCLTAAASTAVCKHATKDDQGDSEFCPPDVSGVSARNPDRFRAVTAAKPWQTSQGTAEVTPSLKRIQISHLTSLEQQ